MALQREKVIRAALALLDQVGLDGLTMRRLAADLGVQNPALYWHFKNKQDLLNQMAETMLADAFAPLGPPDADDPWDAWLTRLAYAFRGALLSHRDGTRVIAEADLSRSPVQDGLDQALGILVATGFASSDALIGILAIFDYTLGATYEEQADPFPPPDAADPIAISELLHSTLDTARLPNLVAALGTLAREHPGHSRAHGFAGGLRLILAGMAATRQRPPD